MASAAHLAQAGRKIQAITMYRELTGADIEASRDAVDAMIVQRGPGKSATKVDPHR